MFEIKNLEWDSEHFNLKIGILITNGQKEDKINLLKESSKYDLIIAKIESDKEKDKEYIESLNFKLKDILLIFDKKEEKNLKNIDTLNIRLIKSNDFKSINKLLKGMFIKSHFYKNDILETDKIEQLYEKWIFNRYKNNENIYIYEKEKKIIGFLVEKKEIGNISKIDLIGIDKEYRGENIATKLIDYFFYKNEGKCFEVGTQYINYNAIRLYEKMGFRIKKAINIYHLNGKSK